MIDKTTEELENIRKKYILSNILLGFVILFCVIILIMIIYPYKIYENLNEFNEVTRSELCPGETQFYRSEFCKYRDVPGTIKRHLLNDYMVEFSPTQSNYPLGCHNILVPMVLPKYLSPGSYYIQTIIEYHVNPFKTVKYVVNSHEFQVLSKEQCEVR